MPSAWTIGPLIIRSDIVLTVLSLLVGVIVLLWLSPLSKKQQKVVLNEISSLGILFILSLMIGKSLLNFDVFINDPRAVIAYPSNSNAFYLALFGVGIWILWKLVYHKQVHHLRNTGIAWMYVFFSALFMYDFFELIGGGSPHLITLINLGIYGGLLALTTFIKDSILLPTSTFILSLLFLNHSIFFFTTDHVLGIGLLFYSLIIYIFLKTRRLKHV
ncbi:hypothetical protein [Pontibacillus marinus]|uniref:Uncharacterized protein n=1 Tax=Pontibacillus marinus BH030004 = DSM 16465 TaxID=1385511 RepID=A0A0A5HMM5_9BACI|nr:hypothetical protein [Pontibacillus marinus]KGX84872.1 hypothetical protein N783_15795 [Pontibacillus marinus BH030004 = DSM 16465]